jgi:hypothetical protein
MSQTFKTNIDKSILFVFLEKVCNKTDKFFLFDLNAYKKGEFIGANQELFDIIKPYYHESKQFYVERKMNYSRMCTVIRQICNSNSIMFSTKIVYSKSKFNIPYHIYF